MTQRVGRRLSCELWRTLGTNDDSSRRRMDLTERETVAICTANFRVMSRIADPGEPQHPPTERSKFNAV